MKSVKALLLAVLMLMSVMLFAACGGEGGSTEITEAPLSAEAAYKDSVVDAAGNSVTGNIAVKFMQNGTQVAMQLVNESGVAEKTMARGEYAGEL